MNKKYVLLRMLIMILAFIPLAAISGEVVGNKENGKWIAGNFAQENLWCTQAWLCKPGVDVLHGKDTIVVTSSNTSTQGICNANGGAIDSCNSCSAKQPEDVCQYWLEKK